jgi:glycosyltransferase involved in cell wall biosynthesis
MFKTKVVASHNSPAVDHQAAVDRRVAWLFPSLERGNYWHPIFKEFSQQYPQTIIYTGIWSGFGVGFEDCFTVEVVGKTKVFPTIQTENGYKRCYIFPSFGIIPKLFVFKPEVIFTSAFSLWTAIALLFKAFFGTRVIVLFDGVSPGADYLVSDIRVFPRRIMSRLIDAFISNSQAGKQYLIEVAWAPLSRVFVKPYLVPDVSALTQGQPTSGLVEPCSATRPIFLYVGQVIPRKGLRFLLQACALLEKQGYDQYTLCIIGEGEERSALENLVQEQGLEQCVQWIGSVNYHCLGTYFSWADVFVFPTLEDIWGMVVSEAMTFGKPVLCSKWAGATEVIIDGGNGYVFDPYDPEKLSELMRRFISQPSLIETMGTQSKKLAAGLTPSSATKFFCHLAETT